MQKKANKYAMKGKQFGNRHIMQKKKIVSPPSMKLEIKYIPFLVKCVTLTFRRSAKIEYAKKLEPEA